MTSEEEAQYLLDISRMPAVLKYTHLVYQTMLAKAQVETVIIPMIDDERTGPVFRGNFTEVCESVKASKGYYSQIRRILLDNGCMYQLERGTAHSPSVILLDDTKRPPMTESDNVKSGALRLTDVDQSVRLLGERVEVMESRLGGVNLTDALKNMETRFSRIERKLGIASTD